VAYRQIEYDEQDKRRQQYSNSNPHATDGWCALTSRNLLLAQNPFSRPRVESGHEVGQFFICCTSKGLR
jgi:hypothetical protein